MRRDNDPEYTMLVDVRVYDTSSGSPPKPPRPTPCRATPKRIYTIGGAVFDRQTGQQIMARDHRAWSIYVRKALVETLRSKP